MTQKTTSLQQLAYVLISIVLGYIILKQGKFILAPLTFAVLLTIMLQPLSSFFIRLVKFKVPAILLTLLSLITGIGIIVTLFSVQLSTIINNLENITENISQGLQEILDWANQNLNLQESDLRQNIPQLAENSVNFIQKGISSVTTFFFSLFFVLLVIFFLLWYQNNIKHFLLIQSSKEKRENLRDILSKIQVTMQKYLYGLLTVIGILSVLNSVGLLIIGIDYAIFWGVLAAFLAVIPYIGTTLGGTLPFLYAIATTGNWWQPAAVVGMYMIIQNIEGNIITPKVVGNSVSINPLVALVSIIIGGFVWGIGGIILAIPLLGVIKIILNHNNKTMPVAFLLSNKIQKDNEKFWEEMDDGKHRL